MTKYKGGKQKVPLSSPHPWADLNNQSEHAFLLSLRILALAVTPELVAAENMLRIKNSEGHYIVPLERSGLQTHWSH